MNCRFPFCFSSRPAIVIANLLTWLPLIWLSGADRVIWYLLPVLVILSMVRNSGRIRPVFFSGGLTFLALLTAASLSAVELSGLPGDRILVYVRDWLAIATATLVFFSPRGQPEMANTRTEAIDLSRSISLLAVLASLMGVGAWIASLNGSYLTPLGKMLGVGAETFENKLLRADESILFSVQFYRLSSLFVSANVFAMVLEVAIPLILYLIVTARNVARRWFWLASLVPVLTALVLTGSRSGVLLLGIEVVVMAYLVQYGKAKSLRRLLPVLAGLVTVSLIVIGGTQIQEAFDALIHARGQSFDARFLMYGETIEAIGDKPLGHAVSQEIQISGVDRGMGTHSAYLGIAYKYGWFGIFLHLLFLVLLFRRWAMGYRRSLSQHSEDRLFYAATGAALLGNFAHQAVIDIAWGLNGFIVILALWLTIVLKERDDLVRVKSS